MTASYDGFLLAHFVNGNTPDAEQIRFALTPSREPDSWRELNGGRPVLRSAVGECGVRDPFIVRDDARGTFVVLATDLRTYPDEDWARAVRWGSRSIVVWESHDLIEWSAGRLAEVAPAGAGNTWAPKAFWSPERSTWLVFFASALYADGAARLDQTHQRILVSETRDFTSFTPAQTYLDPGHDVIDVTFLAWRGGLARFSADSLSADPAFRSQFVRQEIGQSMLSTDFAVVAADLGTGTQSRAEGPAAFSSADGTAAYLLLDEFGERGYQLYRSETPHSGDWQHLSATRLPHGARHGSVIPITATERARLERAYLETSSWHQPNPSA
ncbi:glycoside hydrolase family 43 protein [Leifsonia sp. 2MCAF36]|uniref:glycoside hydrolase family 43 protein n=1 Tax=Leifsonia sp. 2MCAF36 TaxID=3232988 RepID=UPI003F9D53CB